MEQPTGKLKFAYETIADLESEIDKLKKDLSALKKTDSNVTSLNQEKKFPFNAELHEKIMNIIGKYDGEISTAECLGVLELIKVTVIDNAKTKIVNKDYSG